MKRFSKLVALTLAAALVFGMTVNAADSPNTGNTDKPGIEEPGTEDPGTEEPGTDKPGTEQPGTDKPGTEEPGTDKPGAEEPGTDKPGTEQPGTDKPGTEEPGTDKPGTEEPSSEEVIADIVAAAIVGGGVQDSNGNVVDVKVEASSDFEDVYNDDFGKDYEEACDKMLADATISAAIDATIASMGNGDSQTVYGLVNLHVDGEIPEGGLYISVHEAVESAKYVIAHWTGTEWELIPVKVENGYVYGLFTSLSPVSYYIITVSDEEPNKPEENKPEENKPSTSTPSTDNGNGAGSGADSGTPVSPKTGETMPVAGILAVICLAGAVVCAKKVRYNR